MTNLMLVFVVGVWLCGGPPARTTSRNAEAVYAKGHAKLVEVMKIGGGDDEGDDPPVFYQPQSLCVAGDGTIYVLDSKTCEVIAFDRNGELRFRFGRDGEGPGELRQPNRIALDRFGRVVVSEIGNKRFSLFSPRGKFIQTAGSDDFVVKFVCLPDGRLLAQTQWMDYKPTSSETTWKLVVMDSTFHVVAQLDSLKGEPFVVVPIENGAVSMGRPFYEGLVWCKGRDGRVYIGKNSEYKIRVLDEHLAPARMITRDAPAMKVTQGDKKEFWSGPSNLAPEVDAKLHAAIKFPDHKQYFETLYCDGDGNLLVHRGDLNGKTPVFDVFRPDGSFVGEVQVPGLSQAVFDGSTILKRVISDEELPAVIRYRLE